MTRLRGWVPVMTGLLGLYMMTLLTWVLHWFLRQKLGLTSKVTFALSICRSLVMTHGLLRALRLTLRLAWRMKVLLRLHLARRPCVIVLSLRVATFGCIVVIVVVRVVRSMVQLLRHLLSGRLT